MMLEGLLPRSSVVSIKDIIWQGLGVGTILLTILPTNVLLLLLLNLGLLIGVGSNKNAIRMLAPGFRFIGLLFWDLHYHQKIVVVLLWQESPLKFLASKKWIRHFVS